MRVVYKTALFGVLLIFPCCTLLQSYLEVTLELPLLPGQWGTAFEIKKYKLLYPDANGGLVTGYTDAGCKTIQVQLVKNYNSFVLACPVIAGQDICLPPAGAVFPLHLASADEQRLVLTWEAGVVASVYERLWRQGVDISGFNTARLLEVIAEKAPGDPWQIDTDLLAQHIAAHDFSVYDIKLLPARDVALAVPQGSWFLESPFACINANDPGTPLELAAVSYGFHRLFAAGGGMRFDFYLTETDCIMVSP